ncbi:MAG: uroporphyrinogen decarboxylase family protein [Bacteroidota bacterium]
METGLALIKKAFALKDVERVPWVPFVGCHGAHLIGTTAGAYLKDAGLIVKGVTKAIELYQPDGIPVSFDLQIEAEALGCKLAWSDSNPPAVVSHPLADGKELSALNIPGKDDGRIPAMLEATRQLRKAYPGIALYGLITGPFTLALHLLGTEIFIKMFEDPEKVNELLDFTSKVGMVMADYYMDAGCDIIAVVDPMTSQIDPDSFEQFVKKPASVVFDFIRSKEKLSSFFVCGQAQQNIEVMCQCKPDNISIDENIPLDYVKEIALKHRISFGGNIKLTVVLLMGTPEDVQRNALDCMDLAGNKGFILAPGCDIPMDTPVENMKAVTQLVMDPYQADIVRELSHKTNDLALLNMQDYGMSDKVIVDVITLDSESCAPCQYMVEAVKQIAPHFEGIVEWREHAIKKMDAVTFMASLMVKNIPTICIDGKIAFVSKIPPRNELIAAIQKRINEKLRLKIKSRRNEITIFCEEETQCKSLKESFKTAIRETGKDVRLNIDTSRELREEFGISQAPAVVITRYQVKTQGQEPSVDVIKEWLKDL